MKRPRFSLRTLAIVMTMICAYLGLWIATSRHADLIPVSPVDVDDDEVHRLIIATSAPLPLVIRQQELRIIQDTNPPDGVRKITRYYVWLLGPSYRLPFASSWADEPWDGMPHRKRSLGE